MRKNNYQKTFSILIVNFKAAQLIQKLVESIEKYCSDSDLEIIISDNNSPENERKILSELEKKEYIKVIFLNKNLGFGRANNIAFQHSQGKYILLLNPDTVFIEDSLTKVLSFRKKINQPSIIGVRLVFENGQKQSSKLTFPGLWNAFVLAFFLNTIFKGIKWFDRIDYGWHTEEVPCQVDFVRGAFMFMDREVYEVLQGFDEDYFIYTEEADLCYRAWKEGIPVWYYPGTKIVHFEGSSMKLNRIHTWIELYRSQILFMKKHHGGFQSFGYRILLLISAFNRTLLNSLLALLKRDKSLFEKAAVYFYAFWWLLGIPLHKELVPDRMSE